MYESVGVYRAPMRGAVEHALEFEICGLGGRLDSPPRDLRAALIAVDRLYDERTARRLERFAAVPELSFVWTRTSVGAYRLGRILGPWMYDASAAAASVDLVHVRRCRWMPVPEHRVPPAVVQTFARGGRNFQQTHDLNVSRQSDAVWGAS